MGFKSSNLHEEVGFMVGLSLVLRYLVMSMDMSGLTSKWAWGDSHQADLYFLYFFRG